MGQLNKDSIQARICINIKNEKNRGLLKKVGWKSELQVMYCTVKCKQNIVESYLSWREFAFEAPIDPDLDTGMEEQFNHDNVLKYQNQLFSQKNTFFRLNAN
jgi:hypothetical protein